jgi:superfamily I DNA/RNA helicase
MTAERIAEPEDAYREARLILSRQSGGVLPYDHVVVDEAQDFGENAFRLIRALVPPPSEEGRSDADSLFLVGDAHQRIYGRRLSLGRCGVAVRGRSTRLRLNYRTTENIRAYAVSILEGVAVDDLDEDLDTLAGYRSLLKGPDPEIAGFESQTAELAALAERLDSYSPEELREVGIIARINKALDAVEAALEAKGIPVHRLRPRHPDDPSIAGVRLATAHRAKGLEFRDVHIVCVSDGVWPPAGMQEHLVDTAAVKDAETRERSLFHVAATRAKARLFVTWGGEPGSVLQILA